MLSEGTVDTTVVPSHNLVDDAALAPDEIAEAPLPPAGPFKENPYTFLAPDDPTLQICM